METIGIIFSFLFLHLCSSQEYIVQIDQGLLSGTTSYDRKGGIFYSFLSIPYAKPPIGELRFKEPQPADSWDGILNATMDMPQCTQPDGDNNEDCLYLNVYTPQKPSDNYDTLIDVMVYIHGGGFNTGDGRQYSLGPEFLIPENILLVAINYRLGILGSFNLEDTSLGYPGNLNMKDQVLALKWVQSNIAKFGGNPDSVTIFGGSAGGASVHFHVVSPLSAGLFHKAIPQSGTAISQWAVGLRNSGMYLAEALNITTTNTTEMLNQLYSASTSDINAAHSTLSSIFFDNNNWGFLGSPIVEQVIDGQSLFLSDTPLSIIRQGTYNHVPMLIGYTSIDGAVFTLANTAEVFHFPGDLGISIGSQEAVDLLEKINDFYYSSGSFTHPLLQLYTDVWFGYPAYRTAKEHMRTTSSPIYFYRFTADTELNFVKMFAGFGDVEGATHGDDTCYLFNAFVHDFFPIESGSIEDLAVDRIVKLITDFAKYGDPTGDNSSSNLKWLPIADDEFNYADIATVETVPGVDPDWESMQFWDGIYNENS